MRTRLYPPTRVCPSRRPASARDACSPFPCLPHCPVVSPRGSGEGEKGCLSPPRSFNMPEPLRLCPAPPGDAWGGGGLRAPPGVARTCALLGALVASRALVRKFASGRVCARLASPARPCTLRLWRSRFADWSPPLIRSTERLNHGCWHANCR